MTIVQEFVNKTRERLGKPITEHLLDALLQLAEGGNVSAIKTLYNITESFDTEGDGSEDNDTPEARIKRYAEKCQN
jgi:DNA polymerase III delta prime subunit